METIQQKLLKAGFSKEQAEVIIDVICEITDEGDY